MLADSLIKGVAKMPSVKNIIGGLIGGLIGVVTTPVIADSVYAAAGNESATNLSGAARTLFNLVPLIWVGVAVIGGIFISGMTD